MQELRYIGQMQTKSKISPKLLVLAANFTFLLNMLNSFEDGCKDTIIMRYFRALQGNNK
jgi:hypothetical protein